LNPCYINEGDLEKPLLVVFSIKDIEPGGEICFNYKGNNDDDDDDENERKAAIYIKCECKAWNCNGELSWFCGIFTNSPTRSFRENVLNLLEKQTYLILGFDGQPTLQELFTFILSEACRIFSYPCWKCPQAYIYKLSTVIITLHRDLVYHRRWQQELFHLH